MSDAKARALKFSLSQTEPVSLLVAECGGKSLGFRFPVWMGMPDQDRLGPNCKVISWDTRRLIA